MSVHNLLQNTFNNTLQHVQLLLVHVNTVKTYNKQIDSVDFSPSTFPLIHTQSIHNNTQRRHSQIDWPMTHVTHQVMSPPISPICTISCLVHPLAYQQDV